MRATVIERDCKSQYLAPANCKFAGTELSFDAWGNLRDPETWSGSCSGNPIGFGISMAYFVTNLATDSFNGWGKIQY